MAKLITGGTGFVGAELARMLVNRGEDVVIFDRTIKRHRIDDIEKKVKIIQGDVGIWPVVMNAVKENKITEIYHLGSMLTWAAQINPWAAFQANIVGTFNMLEAARLFGVKKFMFASSMGTFNLDLGDVIDDHTIQRPTSFYGCGKLYCEGIGRWYRNNHNLDFRSIRYPAVTGPGDKTPGHWHWWVEMIEAAIKGEPYECFLTDDIKNSMIWFKDAALAADMVLLPPKEAIKTVNYNVNDGEEAISAKDIERSIKKYLPKAVITYKPDPFAQAHFKSRSDVRIFDDSAARKEWGWKPKCATMDDIMKAFLEEVKTYPKRYEL